MRNTGASDRFEEETVERPDLNGNVARTERHVRRSSTTGEQQDEVIETYSPHPDVPGLNGQPALSERVQRTTTPTAEGGRYTVEVVEARSRVSPNEPMRIVRRIVTIVSPGAAGEWVTQRQVYDVDVNGRFRLVRIE